MAAPIRHDFASREALAHALAETVATRLSGAIADKGQAMIAVSGGTTPALFFDTLAQADIAWGNVVVTLVDERFVPADSPRSNAGLVARHLLQGRAAAARFVPLYEAGTSIERAAEDAAVTLRETGLPPDVVILGMGADGHTASFFPDATNLADLLDPSADTTVASVSAPSAGEPRLTLTLAALRGAPFIALHIEGADKRAALDKVLAGETRPIGTVLDEADVPVEIFWAP